VMILSDQEIAQRKETVDPIDVSRFELVERLRPTPEQLAGGYQRFSATSSGISPISHPGMEGGNYLAAGIEHDVNGAPTASGAIHAAMNEKRFQKLAPLQERTDLFERLGPPDAPLALVSWGSSAGVAREAFLQARMRDIPVKLLVPTLLYPVAEQLYRAFFTSVRAGLVLELSHQGQLYRVLRMFVDVPPGVTSFARSGAQPFRADEVVQRLAQQAETLR